jgi:hypothetical protein
MVGETHMNQKAIVSIVLLLFVSVGFIPSVTAYNVVKLIEDRIESDHKECGCDISIDWDFPIICSILLFMYRIVLDNLPFLFFAHLIELTAGMLGDCPGIP